VVTIPEDYRDLLEQPIVVSLATILPNGQPQVTPVWCDLDNGYIRVNTDARRVKYKNMLERPEVAVLAVDPRNPLRYLEIRGRVTHTSTEGASEHIDKLSKEYTNGRPYSHLPGEQRVICYIEPVKALTH